MNVESPEIEERWRRWLVEQNQRGLRAALLIIVTIYPAFGVFDGLLAPRSALPWLWTLRGLIAVGALAVLPLIQRPRVAAWGELIGVGVAWVAAAGICLMTTYMGGLASAYYAGIGVVLIAAGLLLIWRPAVVIVGNTTIVAMFVVVNVVAGGNGPLSVAVSNLGFLSVIALIAGIGMVVQYRTHRDQLVQRIRLEQATAKLERAHAELQQLDQFKSRFFANMSHELRTPLAMILTPLELLMQGELGPIPEAQKMAFGSMHRSALKLLKLINDLLDLSRLEESRLRLRVTEQELVSQLRALVDQSEVLARRRDISLTFVPAVNHLLVRCDPDRLERVFVNLLSNAIKFTPSGGHVQVAIFESPDEVEVEVQDDGRGLPPGLGPEDFARNGHMGLAGMRERIGALGGTARVEGRREGGVRVAVRVPLTPGGSA